MESQLEPKVIAVDGPAGSGKTTVCAELAKRLGFAFLSSGAIYRAFAWAFKHVDQERNLEEFVKRIPSLPFNFDLLGDRFVIKYEQRLMEEELKDPEIARIASYVARVPEVREFANSIQRSLSKETSLVVEGRDVTTVVFPDAFLKIFLTALPEERAKRRWRELISKGLEVDFDEVLKAVIERDRADSERKLAPLIRDTDAVLIDSTNMGVKEIVDYIVELYLRRCHSSS
ncbi:MAG: (d)CMP kinase [Syntrophobacterales bacterium]|nr:(d)CMP kinase [Syntrophobacterales bacterium]